MYKCVCVCVHIHSLLTHTYTHIHTTLSLQLLQSHTCFVTALRCDLLLSCDWAKTPVVRLAHHKHLEQLTLEEARDVVEVLTERAEAAQRAEATATEALGKVTEMTEVASDVHCTTKFYILM